MTTVTVVEPYQVCLNGTVYGPGETVEAPDELAEQWLGFGWVEKPQPKKARAGK